MMGLQHLDKLQLIIQSHYSTAIIHYVTQPASWLLLNNSKAVNTMTYLKDNAISMHMDSTTITIIGASAATVSAVASVINLINSKTELRKMKEKLNRG